MTTFYKKKVYVSQVGIEINTNDRNLASSIEMFFANFYSGLDIRSNIAVNITWKKEFLARRNEVVFEDFDINGNINALVKFNPLISSIKSLKISLYKESFLENILNTAVLFPAIFHLERNSDFHIIDSAALSVGGSGFMLIGEPGSGKSTLSIAIAGYDKSAKLINDDLSLVGNGILHRFPALIRLDDKSVSLAKVDQDILEEVKGYFVDRDRLSYRFRDLGKIIENIIPQKIFTLQRGGQFSLEPATKETTITSILKLTDCNSMVVAYREFISRLFGKDAMESSRTRSRMYIEELVQGLDCYILKVEDGTDLEYVLERLFQIFKKK